MDKQDNQLNFLKAWKQGILGNLLNNSYQRQSNCEFNEFLRNFKKIKSLYI
jgi:hypothetical protein